jgi:hypothetical protein
MVFGLWIFILGLVAHAGLLAAPLSLAEDELVRQQSNIQSLSLTTGTVGQDVENYLKLLRDYEVFKLRELSSSLLRAANEEVSEASSPVADAQLLKVKEKYQSLDQILDEIAGLSITPVIGQNYAKSWHGISVRRNSTFRAYVREILILFRITQLGEAPSLAKARLTILTQAEYTQWAFQLIPYLRSVSSFFFHFFKEIENPHTPHFTPELHRALDLFAKGRGMNVRPIGFDEESRSRFKLPGLHVWVMNHRDIYLDPFFVSQILKNAACDWDCHYAVDPVRYLGGVARPISKRMVEMPDFLPVGDQAGAAIRRAKEIAANSSRANVFIFPEATTSLMGDTAILDPYFALSFVRSLKRLKINGGIHFHIVSTNVSVDPRVNPRQRISQYFRPGTYESVALTYHGSISSDELPQRMETDQAFELNSRIWLAFHRAQETNSKLLHGQLRQNSLHQSISQMFQKEFRCRKSLIDLSGIEPRI